MRCVSRIGRYIELIERLGKLSFMKRRTDGLARKHSQGECIRKAEEKNLWPIQWGSRAWKLVWHWTVGLIVGEI